MTTLPQTVTCAVPFRRRGRRRTEAPTSPPEVAPKVPAGRVPRIARLIDDATAESQAQLRLLAKASREELLDHVIQFATPKEGHTSPDPDNQRALMKTVVESWLEEHEQKQRHARRGDASH